MPCTGRSKVQNRLRSCTARGSREGEMATRSERTNTSRAMAKAGSQHVGVCGVPAGGQCVAPHGTHTNAGVAGARRPGRWTGHALLGAWGACGKGRHGVCSGASSKRQQRSADLERGGGRRSLSLRTAFQKRGAVLGMPETKKKGTRGAHVMRSKSYDDVMKTNGIEFDWIQSRKCRDTAEVKKVSRHLENFCCPGSRRPDLKENQRDQGQTKMTKYREGGRERDLSHGTRRV